jgi:CheY-like chemotaxis protein
VGVESVPGEGSRFWFNIPVPQVLNNAGVTIPAASTTGEAVKAPRRALIIEDSVSAADHLSHYLKELNTEVIVHPQGEDAVQAALQAQPDVILLDLLLPDISGWQVLTHLKTNPHTCDIPVVIVSVVDERRRGISAGATDYLVKPVTREQLHGAILKSISPRGQANRVLVIRPAPAVDTVKPSAPVGPLILFVEDNLINLEAYLDYLKSRGYRIIPAVNGYEALERAREFKPDLILMDIQMPGMDGIEATRRLRAMPEFARVPIIALTALAMPGDRERCLAAGANAYLAKPVSLKQLSKEIQELLG